MKTPKESSCIQTEKVNTRSLGTDFETKACDLLLKEAWGILQRNFRTRTGEIDIIALDGDVLVFIEVKSLRTLAFQDVESIVNQQKQRKIVETSKYFLSVNRKYSDLIVRYDVIAFCGSELSFHHIKGAFTE